MPSLMYPRFCQSIILSNKCFTSLVQKLITQHPAPHFHRSSKFSPQGRMAQAGVTVGHDICNLCQYLEYWIIATELPRRCLTPLAALLWAIGALRLNNMLAVTLTTTSTTNPHHIHPGKVMLVDLPWRTAVT